jgi:putative membrane protein
MENYYWNNWYAGWGWFLWFGVFILIFSSAGNWRYTYHAHRKSDVGAGKALAILNERYARGEITRDEYLRMKNEMKDSRPSSFTSIKPTLT